MNKTVQNYKPGLFTWLEWCVMAGFFGVAVAAVVTTFLPQKTDYGEQSVFSQLESRAGALEQETDPVRRDALCIPLSSMCRSLDAQIPTNSRIFLLDMLGPENASKIGYYFFFINYLYPREVSVSLGKPPTIEFNGMAGSSPASIEDVTKAGYDLALKLSPEGGLQSQVLRPMTPRADKGRIAPIPEADTWIAFLLPLAVALAGSRLARWLFKDLEGVLTTGEWLACGLAVGIFLLTQLNLGLRMLGLRLEQMLAVTIAAWALVELALLVRRWHSHRPQLDASYLWWLLLIPAGVIFWCSFRLAGLEGTQEFDAVMCWEFKAKLIYYTAGRDMWTWASNPAFGYAHLDYPLAVPLLHAFTYAVLGHVNEFVTKFWNQWMLLFLAAAVLGAGQFPRRLPWLTASTITAIILLPITFLFARTEGGTIPLFFFFALASIQIAMGLVEKQPARLRLGLFLLMGAAMVKNEGVILLGIWGFLLLLNRESRAVFWPIKNAGMAAVLGFLAWIPYVLFRSHVSFVHPDTLGMGILLHNWKTGLGFEPMVWLAIVSGRFLNNNFASWSAPDNQHAVWNGQWSGVGSLVDGATLGLGWVCLLALVLFWLRGHRLRWAALFLFALLIIFSIPICLEVLSCSLSLHQAASEPSQLINYSSALSCGDTKNSGRYLFPVLMSWPVVISILLCCRRTEQIPTAAPTPSSSTRRKG